MTWKQLQRSWAERWGFTRPSLRIFTEGRSGKGVSHTEEVHNLPLGVCEQPGGNSKLERWQAHSADGPPRGGTTHRGGARAHRGAKARGMGVGTAEGRRVFREGRAGFNPAYDAADVRVRVVEADNV